MSIGLYGRLKKSINKLTGDEKMALRIKTNMPSQYIQTNLSRISTNNESSLQRLSSGKRINKASDDAAGLAISKRLEAQTRGLRQAVRNTNDGTAFIQTAEGGLNETTNILIRMREISIQSATGTVGEEEKGFLDAEYQQLMQEIDRISESTVFNGVPLLNGRGADETHFQVGAFAGDENSISFDSSSTDITTDNLDVSGLSIAERDDALESIEYLDDALQRVSGFRANLGAIQSRLKSTASNLEIQVLNQDNARSIIEDVDVAKETAKLASTNVIKAAGIATLSQANNIPNAALRLLNN